MRGRIKRKARPIWLLLFAIALKIRRVKLKIKQEILDIAFLETIFKAEFVFLHGFYYSVVGKSKCRFTHGQVEAERQNRKIYLNKGI